MQIVSFCKNNMYA